MPLLFSQVNTSYVAYYVEVFVAVRRHIASKRLSDKQFGTGLVCIGRVDVAHDQAVVPGGSIGFLSMGILGLVAQDLTSSFWRIWGVSWNP